MFYLTLPSNSSFDHFPNNTLSECTTKLPQEINLEGSWEVGIAEISYPHTWYNVSEEGEYWLHYEYKHRVVRVTLEPGYYESPKSIVSALVEEFKKRYGKENLRIRFLYMEFANKFKVQLAGGKKTFGKDLMKLLGILLSEYTSRGTYVTSREIDICQGTYSIFVYCDVIEPRIVGDIMTPLLITIPIEGSHGDYIYKRFEKIHYHPLIRKNFSDIHIALRNDQGDTLKFERGKVTVTLHFRRRKLRHV